MNRITHTISADHRDLAQCYHRIIDAADEDEQTRHQNQFTWQLARHLVGEEVVLFPAMEKNIRDDPVVDEEQQDLHPHPHQQVSFSTYHVVHLLSSIVYITVGTASC